MQASAANCVKKVLSFDMPAKIVRFLRPGRLFVPEDNHTAKSLVKKNSGNGCRIFAETLLVVHGDDSFFKDASMFFAQKLTYSAAHVHLESVTARFHQDSNPMHALSAHQSPRVKRPMV